MSATFLKLSASSHLVVALWGSVLSVFGRTGAVASANGDYTASQITNVAAGTITAVTVQAAINELDTTKEPTITPNTGFNLALGTGSGQVAEGDHNHTLVSIPPGVIHGFKGISDEESIIINVPTEAYNSREPDEFRKDAHDPSVPYDWSRKDG